jgi:hypothetical protein
MLISSTLKIATNSNICMFRLQSGVRSASALIGVQGSVSKGVEDGYRPPTLQVGHPCNGRKAVLRVARLQGVEE